MDALRAIKINGRQCGEKTAGLPPINPKIIDALSISTPVAGLAGAGVGYTLAKLMSPHTATVQNIRKAEEIAQLGQAIDEIKMRMAVKQQRLSNI